MSAFISRRLSAWFVVGVALRLVAAAALAVDAYTHADLVARYDPNQGSAALSQGDLFRIEAGVAAFAALLLILSARRLVWAFAVLVAASALGAILFYRYYDPGVLGPLPDMYEPIWFPEKATAAVAEAAALVAAVAGGVIAPRNQTERDVRTTDGARTPHRMRSGSWR